MNEAILNKLHAALYHISPLASDRDRIIERIGETVWVETLDTVLKKLPEDSRHEVVALLNADDLDAAVAMLEVSGIDLDAVITEVATSVMNEVLETVKEQSAKNS
jgi:hypothetical protein